MAADYNHVWKPKMLGDAVLSFYTWLLCLPVAAILFWDFYTSNEVESVSLTSLYCEAFKHFCLFLHLKLLLARCYLIRQSVVIIPLFCLYFSHKGICKTAVCMV